MGDYSVLADMLNKFHTSTGWIQFFWIVSIPAFLLGLCWCFKEICIAFANSIEKTFIAFANRSPAPEGELLYAIYRNDKQKLVLYCNNITQEEMRAHNLILPLPMGEEPNQIEGQIEDRITEETDEAGGANEALANNNSDDKEERII